MSYELAIINPRKRSSKKRRKFSAKQLAAQRKFAAKYGRKRRKTVKRKTAKTSHSGVSVMAKRKTARRNAKGRFTKKTHATRRRRRSSSAGKRRAATGYVVGSRPIRRRKLNPRRKAYRRRRSNPRFSVGGITGQVIPALYGAGGAIALNIALSYIPLPAALSTGWARHGVRLVGALGLGWAARKFLGAKGNAVAAGALTVVVYDILKGVLAQAAPDLGARLGEYEDVSLSGDEGFTDPASIVSGMGAYLTGPMDGPLDGVGDMSGMGAYLEEMSV